MKAIMSNWKTDATPRVHVQSQVVAKYSISIASVVIIDPLLCLWFMHSSCFL